MKKFISLLLAVGMLSSSFTALAESTSTTIHNVQISAQRKMETLDRGLTVQSLSSGGTYLNWRLFQSEDTIYGTAKNNVTFNIYKNGTKIATEEYTTNYIDSEGTDTDIYQVAAIIDGVEEPLCEETSAFESGSNYFDVLVDKPADVTFPQLVYGDDGKATGELEDKTYSYTLNDTSCGDIDGDGKYELIVKWEANGQDNSTNAYTGNVLIDAYELDGSGEVDGNKRLWRIDLGKNIRAGAHYTQFLVYDFNQDGKAEVVCKTAPGSMDNSGEYVTKASSVESIYNVTDEVNQSDLRNIGGKALQGDEYLTVFNGETGIASDTIYYPVERDPEGIVNGESFGDNYGNRSERYVADVAWLDGEKPYAVYWRGYYHGKPEGRTGIFGIAINSEGKFDTSSLRIFDTLEGEAGYTDGNEIYIGQGNHNMTVADLDEDGKDEFICGALCMQLDDNDNLNPLWCSYRQHGDALHIGDYDPTNEGLEYFSVHEDSGTSNDGTKTLDYGMTLYNGKDGTELLHIPASGDTGRGVMANVGSGGYFQFWGAGLYQGLGNNKFEKSEILGGSSNFRIYWDGDLYDELLDDINISNWNGSMMQNVFTANGCLSNNSSKATPCLQADLFGDWREEVVYRLKDNSALRVFTTDIPTNYKLKTLMHDSLYRSGVAAEQSGYNQPPHVSMFMDESSALGNVLSAKLTKTPLKTTYLKGQDLNLTGIEITGTYDTGRTGVIKDYTVDGYDSQTIGTQTLTVSVNDEQIGTFDVNVSDSGTNYYSENFDEYSMSSLTITKQGKTDQSQTLDNLSLHIGSKSAGGDNMSGFSFLDSDYGKKMAFYSGGTASASRGGYFNFDKCKLPKFKDLAEEEILTIDFDAYFHDKNSNIQLFGVTSSKTGSSDGFFDPYLSVNKNASIPIDEWVNVKIDINNKKTAVLTITDMDKNVKFTKSFTTSGEYFEKAAGYATTSVIDIGYLSVYTTNSINSINIGSLPQKTEFGLHDELDLTGLVVNAVYDLGNTREIGGYEVSGFDNTKLGTQEITVSYNGYTTSFDITIVDLIKSIEVGQLPSKTRYLQGENIDLTGLVINNVYNSGKREEIKDYDISAFDNQIFTPQTITVTSGDFTTSFIVKVVTQNNVFFSDNFENYTAASITMTKQSTVAQSQTLGDLDLAIGTRGGTSQDNVSGFDLVEDTKNKYLKISTGGIATAGRGASFNFNESRKIPAYADIEENKNLCFEFDAMFNDNLSTLTIDGLTGAASKTSTISNDKYLSPASNSNLPVGKWVHILLSVNNKNEVNFTLTDINGNILDTQVFKTVKPSYEIANRFSFYGSGGTSINIDNLKVYSDYAVSDLKIQSQPVKTTYLLGENLDLTGLTVYASFSDGTTQAITDYTVSGFDSEEIGNKKIFVNYKGKSASFNVDVATRLLTGISIPSTPTKTTYIEGTALDLAGLIITADYSDNTHEKITDYQISEFEPNKLGKQTITVSYSGKTATFDVNVIAKTLTNISIDSKPTKLSYKEGENLDLTGLVVKANYDNNTSSAITDYQISGFDANKIGEQTITVSYSGKTATFKITVLTSMPYINIQQNLESTDKHLVGQVIANIQNNADTAVMILAIFNEDGSLESMESKNVTNIESVTFTAIDLPWNNQYHCDYYYKVFAWNSLESQTPITPIYNSLNN